MGGGGTTGSGWLAGMPFELGPDVNEAPASAMRNAQCPMQCVLFLLRVRCSLLRATGPPAVRRGASEKCTLYSLATDQSASLLADSRSTSALVPVDLACHVPRSRSTLHAPRSLSSSKGRVVCGRRGQFGDLASVSVFLDRGARALASLQDDPDNIPASIGLASTAGD